MLKVLIVYGTNDGHTKKIAQRMATVLTSQGCSADVCHIRTRDTDPSPELFDLTIVAASVHVGKYQNAVRQWVRHHSGTLNQNPSAFISVCLAVLEKNPESDSKLGKILESFSETTKWKPKQTLIVAGAISYTRYGFLKKWIMKRIARKFSGDTDTSRDYEYTDWQALGKFGQHLIEVKRSNLFSSDLRTTVGLR
jgi:menaquinone-dependent protoporphyrinogen oxidase